MELCKKGISTKERFCFRGGHHLANGRNPYFVISDLWDTKLLIKWQELAIAKLVIIISLA